MVKKKEKEGTKQQVIKVKLKAYDHRILDESIREIIKTVDRTGAKMVGPIPLPTKIEKYTVLRSPHVDKGSMETFEIRTHKRLFEIESSGRRPCRDKIMIGIIGKKIGMTQIFNEEGKIVPVTVLQAGPCTVIQK